MKRCAHTKSAETETGRKKQLRVCRVREIERQRQAHTHRCRGDRDVCAHTQTRAPPDTETQRHTHRRKGRETDRCTAHMWKDMCAEREAEM